MKQNVTVLTTADYGNLRASGGVECSGRLPPSSLSDSNDNGPPIAAVKFVNTVWSVDESNPQHLKEIRDAT